MHTLPCWLKRRACVMPQSVDMLLAIPPCLLVPCKVGIVDMLSHTGRRAVPCCGLSPLYPKACAPLPACAAVCMPGGLRQEISDEVMAAARQLQEQHADDVPGLTAPAAVVHCSAITGGRRGWRYA